MSQAHALDDDARSVIKKNILQRFSQYVFQRETIEIRDDLHEGIVELVLFDKNNTFSRQSIKNLVYLQMDLFFDQSIIY